MNDAIASAQSPAVSKLDQSAMTVNQIFIIGLPVLGFIFNSPWPLMFTALVMLIGLVIPQFRLFNLIYMHVVKPLGLLKPNVITDDPAPHRFAHLLGGIFLLVACGLIFLDYSALGWIFCWIVVGLAQLNLQAHFCVGCFMYLHLSRLISTRS
jgi:hypothetical protein